MITSSTLFTSFGYFETLDEHQTTLQNIHNGLNEKGLFIFDFMNTEYVLNHLVAEETIQKESVSIFTSNVNLLMV